MLNSVGLQGPGIERFLADELPALVDLGVSVVVSIWGRSVADFAAAAAALADAPGAVVAVEVNVSCPNVADGHLFAHSAAATEEVLAATAPAGRPAGRSSRRTSPTSPRSPQRRFKAGRRRSPW